MEGQKLTAPASDVPEGVSYLGFHFNVELVGDMSHGQFFWQAFQGQGSYLKALVVFVTLCPSYSLLSMILTVLVAPMCLE